MTFSTMTMKAIGEWKNISKMPKVTVNLELYTQQNYFPEMSKIDIFRHVKAECVFYQ